MCVPAHTNVASCSFGSDIGEDSLNGIYHVIDEETRDGPLTFDEAFVYTEGLKLVTMDRPIIVDKETLILI